MSRGQKHQNTEAWVPNRADKHNSLQQLVNKLPSGAEAGLCQKCDEVVAWKKQFGKYKPLKQPAKCVACRAPAVMLAPTSCAARAPTIAPRAPSAWRRRPAAAAAVDG